MNSRHLFILASLLLLISCSKKEPLDIYNNLDHSQWFKYKEGDTLIFNNNASAVDTYIIDRVSNFYAKPLSTYDEHLMVDYKEIPQCNNCPIWGFLRGPGGVSFTGEFTHAYFHYEDTTIEYKLGDTTLNDIYVVEDLPTTDNYKVKALYYSHVYGYIRYDMYDDRVYELQLE